MNDFGTIVGAISSVLAVGAALAEGKKYLDRRRQKIHLAIYLGRMQRYDR